ncbi:MAG TPA: bifunctional RNase H/acid phosphatase [Jiangellaceae bacterium]|nr:bifunctional RNase H/acid phosphatase [Jiangellaceae bacterium]
MSRRLVVEADGGSRGNPGPAAYGALVRDPETGEVLAEVAEAIGVATNNVAEYRGLIAGLAAAREVDPSATVQVRLDSKLIVEQMSGRWKIKNSELRPLALEANRILPPEQVTYTWVPRNQNTHADRLVNRALDGESASFHTAAEAGRPAPAAVVPEPSTATTLLLVRHGQTPDTAARRFAGGDVPGAALDPVGMAQAGAAAAALADSGAGAVVASPLVRTGQTADAIAARLGLPVTTDAAWRECEFGAWEGLPAEEAAERFPRETAGWRTSTASPAPGGESLDQMAARIFRARDRLLDRFGGQTVVVVTHSMPIRALVCDALGAPSMAIHQLRPAPGSVTELLTYPGAATTMTAFGLRPWTPA